MGAHGHFKEVCKCGTVIAQCRCMSEKTLIEGTCDACKIIAAHQEAEEEHAG
jgi:hypothetical protein